MNDETKQSIVSINSLLDTYKIDGAVAVYCPEEHDVIVLCDNTKVSDLLKLRLPNIDMHASIEYTDEYSICIDCAYALRTSPNFAFWHAPLLIEGAGYVCNDCVKAGKEDDYIMEHRLYQVVPHSFNYEKHDLVKVNIDPFQCGLHINMTSDPIKIMTLLEQAGIYAYVLTEPSQFYIDYYVLVSKPDRIMTLRLLAQAQLTHREG